ncbi:MAG: hypothetical protein R3Y58_06910 [Eubacteriales bacterium]
MANLVTLVDRTTGNFQDVFIYTINASFNGIQDTIETAQIKILFPSFLTVYLGDVRDPIKNVTQEILSNGTLYTFDFGSITDLGIAVRFGVGVVFSPTTASETTTIIAPVLWINGNSYLSSLSEPITLLAVPQFIVTQELIIPKVAPTTNGLAYYRVTLQNYGDTGAAIEDIEITCRSNELLQVDADYEIIGKDISSSGFEDISQDGVLGSVIDNSVFFYIKSFHGESYEFIFRAYVDSTAPLNKDLTSTFTWISNQENEQVATVNTPISDSIYNTGFSLYGPDYALPNNFINYEATFSNEGNQNLDNARFTITLPENIDFYSFTTGAYALYNIETALNLEYSISYTTNTGRTETFGIFNTDTNTTIALDEIIPTNDTLISLTWEFTIFPVGFVTKISPCFDGIINESITLGSMLLCVFDISYYANNIASSNRTNCATMIQDICVLTPTFSSSNGTTPIKPGEMIRYTIGANCRNSRLSTPFFVFLLPKELMYVGNVGISVNEYFDTGISVLAPEPIVIPNYNENSDTLISFSFIDAYQLDFTQKSRIRISFDAQVLTSARGEFSTYFLLNTIQSSGQVASNRNSYTDSEERFSSSSNLEKRFDAYAKSSTLTTTILFFLSISSRKEVKGFLDNDFINATALASTMEGEEVFYKITLENTGNAALDTIEIIDILPHLQDKGIIETTISRNSEFPLVLTSELSVLHTNTNDSDTTLDYDIYYSTSTDPKRFGNSFDVIGSDENWSLDVPDALNSIRSLRIITKGQKLHPDETLTLLFKTIVPHGVSSNSIAWNSFAADITYTDTQGRPQHLLAIEPDKVGVKVLPPDNTKGYISGFVFWDKYKDDCYHDKTQLISATNDIGVVLYNKHGIPLRATVTSTTMDGRSGYYTFSNLELAQYYVRFFIDDTLYVYSKYSRVNSYGITPLIDLTLIPFQDTILASIYSRRDKYIDTILEVNHGSQQLIRNVIYNQMLLTMKQEDVTALTFKEKD